MKIEVQNAKQYIGKTLSVLPSFVFDDFSTPEKSCFYKDGDYAILPGFVDVHVHLREPGFSYKETICTGSFACAHGGYTSVCSMPNLNPTPDNLENLRAQLDIIKRDSVINILPYACITVGQKGQMLSDMEALAPFAAGFSDDGRGVQSNEIMQSAMETAKSLGKLIVAHCEDNSLLHGGYIHLGKYCKEHSHKGICSESEWRQIERDLSLAAKTGCAYHVCHISTKESVELIRQAKKQGLDVSCETAPHYLLLDDSYIEEDGRFKMNPPLRDKSDREALLEGITDGTVDMIATDHAPHSKEEKSRGLELSLMGVVGIETAFPLLYTYLVKENVISLDRLIELMSVNPKKRFSIADNGFTIFDLGCKYQINPDDFLSKGRSTPFKGYTVYGECIATVTNNSFAYIKGAQTQASPSAEAECNRTLHS